tara:strand:+ start:250 stop:1179 length:930 start_codon:yes stop_codon:yes gene_type:complete
VTLPETKIPILIDTDTNNELDDQHALAYAFFNNDVFDIKGITVNHTTKGSVEDDFEEAKRVMQLCHTWDTFPLLKGVNTGTYSELSSQLNQLNHEGHEAVNFIIAQAHAQQNDRLILAPIGKLTNIALALTKDPSIVDQVKIIWLGGNYDSQDGEDGEHNLMHDTTSYNAVITSGVDFSMVTVRYGKTTGTAAVAVHIDEIQETMPGLGPQSRPITGRHGGRFSTFGDYSVNLFNNTRGNTRALFDMVVFAVLKNPHWGESSVIPAPRLNGRAWSGNFNDHTITLIQNFDKEAIRQDFFESMQSPSLSK